MAEPLTCRICCGVYPAYYCGARGHSLRHEGQVVPAEDVCADCWENHRGKRGGFFANHRTRLDVAAEHLAQGHTQAEAAQAAGMSTRTLQKKLDLMRKPYLPNPLEGEIHGSTTRNDDR